MVESISPVVTSLNAPFWEGAAAGRLVLPRCAETGRFFWPPSPVSPFADAAMRWQPADPAGTLETVAIYHRIFQAPLADRKSYGIGLVALAVGPRLLVHIGNTDAFVAGDPVRLTFAPLLPDLPAVPTIAHA